MQYQKPMMKINEVNTLLSKIYENKIYNLQRCDEGQIAQTFTYQINKKIHFIQFNYQNMSQGSITEIFFKDRFKLNNIPTRKIIKIDNYKEYSYLITEKAIGSPFHQLDTEEQLLSLSSVLEVILKISKVKIFDTQGYGWLNTECNGIFKSWKEHLLQIMDEEPGYFYGNWHELFESTFLERTIFERYYKRMKELLNTINEIRQLIHSGLGYGNVLVEEGKVTAILDWQDARYGDSLYDIAYLLFWRQESLQKQILEYFYKYIQNRDYDIRNMQNRIACYKYYIGLDGMRFFAKTNDINGYNATISILEKIEK